MGEINFSSGPHGAFDEIQRFEVDMRDHIAVDHEAIAMLAGGHRIAAGDVLMHSPTTASTDARSFGLYADTPGLVYRPAAETIHGFNQRLVLESIHRVTKPIALFLAEWSGLEKV